MEIDTKNFSRFHLNFGDISFIEKSFLDDEFGHNSLNERGMLLYTFAKIIKAKVIIETGTSNGFSAACLGKAIKDNRLDGGMVHTIDCYGWGRNYSLHYNAQETLKMNQLENVVTLHEGISIDILPSILKGLTEKVDFAHIDSEHDFETPKKEFELIEPYLNQGAYIFFHDTDIEDVKNAVNSIFEVRRGKYENITIPLHSEMIIFRKV